MVAMYQAQKSTRSRSDNGGPGGEVPGRRRVQLFIYLIQDIVVLYCFCYLRFYSPSVFNT